jgi:molybdopterin synthase sulfur carrier subunit
MKIIVRGFGPAGDILGGEAVFEVSEGTTLERVKSLLRGRFPKLEELWSAMAVAVNEEVLDSDRPLNDGDEVILIPPVSGG